MSQKTVTINGVTYDAHTGMPVESVDKRTTIQPSHAHSSQSIHQTTQKSQTLNRRVVKNSVQAGSQMRVHPHIKKSSAITKFAPHPADITRQAPRVTSDIAPVAHHPLAIKAQQHALAQSTTKTNVTSTLAPKPSHIIKQEAIAEALSKGSTHDKKQDKQPRKFGRIATIGSASLALFLLAGYFTYLNMPSLSVRVAAAQAGINASYPEYHPDGYSLSGAVAYSQGEVNMKFASNSGPQNFTIIQKKSSWDSGAVLDNYVKQKAGDNYITYSEGGLTIYTYGSDAAWVNNGILYTVNGDAPLSSDQIRHIATSM